MAIVLYIACCILCNAQNLKTDKSSNDGVAKGKLNFPYTLVIGIVMKILCCMENWLSHSSLIKLERDKVEVYGALVKLPYSSLL